MAEMEAPNILRVCPTGDFPQILASFRCGVSKGRDLAGGHSTSGAPQASTPGPIPDSEYEVVGWYGNARRVRRGEATEICPVSLRVVQHPDVYEDEVECGGSIVKGGTDEPANSGDGAL